jgi:AcrR family transcriptional regulator
MLTSEEILDASEDVLRRFGPEKTNVVDVARALDVSHGTIYRHFDSKGDLLDAVVRRWLHRVSEPLAEIAAADGPPEERLHRWLTCLADTKQSKAEKDPEMFATYHALAQDAGGIVQEHVDELVGQLATIIEDGVAAGAFQVEAPDAAARAVYGATVRFHHPVHAPEWADPEIDAQFEAVWRLIRDGLTSSS